MTGLVKADDLETAGQMVGTTGSPVAEIMLRAQLAGWPKGIQDFMNAELQRGDASDVFLALNNMFVSTLAALAAGTLDESGDQEISTTLANSYRDRFADTIALQRAIQQAAG